MIQIIPCTWLGMTVNSPRDTKDGIKRFVLSTFVLFVSFVVNRMRNANNGMQADVLTSRR
jgi:hypothetical protein